VSAVTRARLGACILLVMSMACSSKGTPSETGAPAVRDSDTVAPTVAPNDQAAATDARTGAGHDPAATGDTAVARKDPMSNTKLPDPGPPPGIGTGIDRDGNLIRQRPENQPPPVAIPPEMMNAHDDHVLLFTALLVADPALLRRTWVQLGLADAGGHPTPKMTPFMASHDKWLEANPERVLDLMTSDKAKAYLLAHLK
jgi:hypothetical protein